MGAVGPGWPTGVRRNPRRKEARHRCEHMDGSVHEGDARRQGRDGAERPPTRVLPAHLQAPVPQDQARLHI